jgi:Cu+-exporting ATPase
MMVGDGVNDSIALTYSDVSVGLAKGSDIALSSSDFVLMNNDLNNIFLIIGLSKKINRNIKFNLFWAFLYNVTFIPVAAGVFAS